ncbi:MAG: hypothetical protein JWN04_6133 [Myxococcaceae bacterium]|nr:hypothetical protein [Myxococcaceae bacterium]
MSRPGEQVGPVKAWIEPDRWAFWRAFPLKSLLLLGAAAGSATLGYALHPVFFILTGLSFLRHAAAEASLRELFRDGMLHPSMVVEGARGLLATLVRLDNEGRAQDAVVISRMPRRWTRQELPWGGARAAMVIAGNPPRLKPLSPDVAGRDLSLARRAAERIPASQWHALEHALAQLGRVGEGVHPVELGSAPWYGSVRDLEVEGSLPPQLAPSEQHAWCAGLPSVEQPLMADEERKRVTRLRTRARRSAAGSVFAALAGVSLLLAVDMPPGVRSPLLLLAFFVVPLSLLWAGSCLLRARAYGRDLREGRLLRFAGTLSTFDSLALDRDLALLARRGVFAPEPGVEQDLVLLKNSCELLHANGKWAPHGVTLHVSEVAAPPDDAVKLVLPRELRSDSASTLDVGRRRFTSAELRELETHCARMRKPGSALFLLTPFALSVVLVWAGRGWTLPPHLASAPLVLAMWFFALQTFLRRLRFSSRLRADAELGWVVTVDHDPAGESDDPELPARGVESLLHARLDWTVNRRPATWRRFNR